MFGLISLMFAHLIGRETGCPHALTMSLSLATFYYSLQKKYVLSMAVNGLMAAKVAAKPTKYWPI